MPYRFCFYSSRNILNVPQEDANRSNQCHEEQIAGDDETVGDAFPYSCMSWHGEEAVLRSDWLREMKNRRLAIIFVIGLFSPDKSRSTGAPLDDPR
jgi:hypothetical protein